MNKSSNNIKKLFLLIILFFSVFMVSASSNVVDVVFSESAYEYVTYNPSKVGSGIHNDPNENQSVYTITGNITITNTHATEGVNNVVLNISSENIYGLAFSTGARGFVTSVNLVGNYSIITVPDLAAGQSSVFTYNVNTTRVAPPLNFTTSYSDTKVFAGLPITVFDTVQNVLNSTNYPQNCIYNINITQNAGFTNLSGSPDYFKFQAGTEAGSDSTNVSYDALNQTLFWNVLGLNCLNSTENSNINYDVTSPSTVTVGGDYIMSNTTIKYNLNTTLSKSSLNSINAILDVNGEFEKYMDTILTGDNATWRISGAVNNPTDINVNLTQVTFWVSQRNGTGTGFTNPSLIDNDTISAAPLTISFTPNFLLNGSTGNWNNTGNDWYFNYTFSSSPIVWMNLQNNVIDDGIQLTDREVTYGNNSIYVKELYIATGYWLQVTKNITRLAEGNYSVLVTVLNRGTSPTPTGQVVMVYNFIPNTFNLTSPFVYSLSNWYSTSVANETLSDPIYNGTMFQFGLLPDTNPFSSSLAAYGSGPNINNTWTVEYNVSGSGEFQFDDLFLSGVDPLNVQELGSTKGLSVESVYGFISAKAEYVLVGVAAVAGILLFLF